MTACYQNKNTIAESRPPESIPCDGKARGPGLYLDVDGKPLVSTVHVKKRLVIKNTETRHEPSGS